MQSCFNARLFDELTPLYPDSDVSCGMTQYTVAGANGTCVGVSIAVCGLTPGIPLTIEVQGEHTAFKLLRMLPVPVEVNTGAKLRTEYLKNDSNTHVIRRAPFLVYDALEPVYNIVMADLTTMGLAFKTVIEYCHAHRTQHWSITLSHGGERVVLHLDVEQFPAVVPPAGRDTHKFVNWFNFDAIARYHALVKWSADYWTMLEKYLRAAVFTRQNMLAIPLEEVFEGTDLNCERLRRIIDTAKQVGIPWFQGGAFAVRAASLADDDTFYSSLDHTAIISSDEIAETFKQRAFEAFDYGTQARIALTGAHFPSAQGTQDLRTLARQLYAFIAENHLADSWIQCVLDEPNDALADTYHALAATIRAEMPGIPLFEPVLPTQKVAGALDIWCPSTDVYENDRDFYDARVAAGERLFVYTCLTPGGNYCNRLLDMERLRIVYLAWALAKYPNIEGFLHWGANQFFGSDPLKFQAAQPFGQGMGFHPKCAMFLPAGDACIFYPGFGEPLLSVRSEAHRIGFEDLCLLQTLAAKDAPAAEKIVSALFRSYDDWENSVSRYRAVRRELLLLSV